MTLSVPRACSKLGTSTMFEFLTWWHLCVGRYGVPCCGNPLFRRKMEIRKYVSYSVLYHAKVG